MLPSQPKNKLLSKTHVICETFKNLITADANPMDAAHSVQLEQIIPEFQTYPLMEAIPSAGNEL